MAVAATGYWSTVAWLVASRTNAVLVDGFDRAEVDHTDLDRAPFDEFAIPDMPGGPSDFPIPGGTVPRAHFHGPCPIPLSVLRVPGYRKLSLGVHQLGLATDEPRPLLYDLPEERLFSGRSDLLDLR